MRIFANIYEKTNYCFLEVKINDNIFITNYNVYLLKFLILRHVIYYRNCLFKQSRYYSI